MTKRYTKSTPRPPQTVAEGVSESGHAFKIEYDIANRDYASYLDNAFIGFRRTATDARALIDGRLLDMAEMGVW